MVSDEAVRRQPGTVARVIRATVGNYLVIVLLATVVLGGILSPYFLTVRNIENVLTFAAIISVMAVGQFFVVVTGGIDLSVGSVAALSTVVVAVMLEGGSPALVAAPVAVLIATTAGLINGIAVVKLGITPFVATLAMMSIARGIAYMIQVGSLISVKNAGFISFFSGKTGPLPHSVVIFVAVMLAAAFAMRYTTFGRRLYAIGGNAEAARLSGLPVPRTTALAYVLSGFLAGLGGMILSAQLTQGSSLLGQGYELDTIAAVVVGGASLAGGTGGPVGAVIGGLIIGAIGNIMNLYGIPSEPQLVVKGILILLAVFFITGDGVSRVRSWFKRRPLAPEGMSLEAPVCADDEAAPQGGDAAVSSKRES